jgi:hypothetical protein
VHHILETAAFATNAPPLSETYFINSNTRT